MTDGTEGHEFPCPQSGCGARAVIASAHEVFEEHAWIWRCDGGHHGPRMSLRD